MNKQQLAAKIWESANKMRSKIEANEYKDYILGFIFYKFLSDKEVKYLKEIGYTDEYMDTVTEEYPEVVQNLQNRNGYFIAYNDLFSTWLAKGSDFNVSDVRDALSAFSRLISDTHKKVFKGVFDTLQTGLSKLGDTANSQTKAISDLINLIKDIPMDGKQDYDVLGFIYEYLISNFAANAGKKAGEFYTPHEVSVLMSEIVADHLKDREKIEIYDPTSGSGSLLINIGKSVAKYMGDSDKIKYYAQELKQNTYNLTRMNLVMRGILPDNIVTRNGDTLEDDWPYFEDNDPVGTYEPLYVDAVVSNPPYSQNWNPVDKETDPRFSRFGVAPKGKADYAFLLHDLFHLKSNGIMTIVLPHGVLFRGGEEGTIRKNLIENNHIDTIIGLPANIFFGTGIPTIIMVLKQKRENTDVLIVDASKGFEKVGNNNKLRACDIKKIADVVTQRLSVVKFSRLVTRDEIRANEYNLNIPRYVDSSEKPESWDIYASMFGGIPRQELDELTPYWLALPGLKETLFEATNDSYYRLRTESIKGTVNQHPAVLAFYKNYQSVFAGFDSYLEQQLLDSMQVINISKEEATISEDIFQRLEAIALTDKYEAYQILDNNWNTIANDLEIIQTEGFAATKQVDPNMVIKKKDGKDKEVQEGWKGHILPFSLVQETYLSEDLRTIKKDEERVNEISAQYEELLEEIPEEEKEKEFINEDKTAFVWPEIKKTVKAKDAEPEILALLKKAAALNEEEKKVKKRIKDNSAALHIKTKETIENLSDAQVNELLNKKWILPLTTGLCKMPEDIVGDLISKIENLTAKYSSTLAEVEYQIRETEEELDSMLDDLVGDEYDMQGIRELKAMLGGKHDENKPKETLYKIPRIH
ncbi:MAG: type I restriction-modification system subunit M [Acidaminococcaceae bacterium]|nr:type I restriction-modification system subunit M [Acidaminococcaceae bacterium]